MRIRIDLAYDGTDFSGWAKQPGLRTVQGDLEDALATVLRLPSVSVTCAGRTDTGVHARAQVVHLDVEGEVLTESAGRIRHRPVDALQRRLNGILRPRRAGTPGQRGAGGLRRALLRALAALRLPDRRRRAGSTR